MIAPVPRPRLVMHHGTRDAPEGHSLDALLVGLRGGTLAIGAPAGAIREARDLDAFLVAAGRGKGGRAVGLEVARATGRFALTWTWSKSIAKRAGTSLATAERTLRALRAGHSLVSVRLSHGHVLIRVVPVHARDWDHERGARARAWLAELDRRRASDDRRLVLRPDVASVVARLEAVLREVAQGLTPHLTGEVTGDMTGDMTGETGTLSGSVVASTGRDSAACAEAMTGDPGFQPLTSPHIPSHPQEKQQQMKAAASMMTTKNIEQESEPSIEPPDDDTVEAGLIAFARERIGEAWSEHEAVIRESIAVIVGVRTPKTPKHRQATVARVVDDLLKGKPAPKGGLLCWLVTKRPENEVDEALAPVAPEPSVAARCDERGAREVAKTKTYLEKAKGYIEVPPTDPAKVEAARAAWRARAQELTRTTP